MSKNAHRGIAVPGGTSWEYLRTVQLILRPVPTRSNKTSKLTLRCEPHYTGKSTSSTYVQIQQSLIHTRFTHTHTECTRVEGDSRVHHTALTGRAPHIKTVNRRARHGWSADHRGTTISLNRGIPIHDAITAAAEVRSTLSLGRNIVLCRIYRRDLVESWSTLSQRNHHSIRIAHRYHDMRRPVWN